MFSSNTLLQQILLRLLWTVKWHPFVSLNFLTIKNVVQQFWFPIVEWLYHKINSILANVIKTKFMKSFGFRSLRSHIDPLSRLKGSTHQFIQVTLLFYWLFPIHIVFLMWCQQNIYWKNISLDIHNRIVNYDETKYTSIYSAISILIFHSKRNQ